MRRESWLWRIAPSWYELLIYSVVALVLLLVGSYRNWVSEIIDPQIEANLLNTIGSRASEFTDLVLQNTGLSASVVSFLFWLVVSSIIYTVGLFLLVGIKDFLNEIEVSLLFVHPRSFTESKHWSSFVLHYLLRFAALLLIIGYCAFLLYVLWPTVLTQVSYGLSFFSVNSILLHALPAFLLSIVALHFLVLLVQMLFWRRSVDYWRSLKAKQ